MRAITLKLKAFGPYLEEQVVDFEDLGEESIFLITGPTGSGKTTIFDAICYALYGRASGSDRDQDSLRSHFASEAEQTEVLFQFALHKRVYEISRSPKQVRKKARGDGYTDEPAKAILYEIIAGEKQLISSRINDINETLQEKLGFNYEQFSKMVLIPQGEFRKLISENSREREAILQSIFDTYFYEQITTEMKVEAKELKEKAADLEKLIHHEVKQIHWLYHTVEESDTIDIIMGKIKQELALVSTAITEATEKSKLEEKALKASQAAFYLNQTLEKTFLDYENLLKEQLTLNQTIEAIQLKKEALKLAIQADKIKPFEEQSATRKNEWQEQLRQLSVQNKKVEQLKESHQAIESIYEKELDKKTEREQIKEEIDEGKKQLVFINDYLLMKEEAKKIEISKLKEENDRVKLKTMLEENEKEIVKINQVLESEQELTLNNYNTQAAIDKLKEQKIKLITLATEFTALEKLRENYRTISKEREEKLVSLKSLRESYEMATNQQQEQYAAYMADQLEDGLECPVCGSEKHPNKAAHQTALIKLQDIEVIKAKLEAKEAAFITFEQLYNDSKSAGRSQRDLVNNLYEPFGSDMFPLNLEAIAEKSAIVDKEIIALDITLTELAKLLKKINTLKTNRINIVDRNKQMKEEFSIIEEGYTETNRLFVQISTRLEEQSKQLPPEVRNSEEFKQMITRKETNYNLLVSSWEKIQTQYKAIDEQLQRETTILSSLEGFEKDKKVSYEKQVIQLTNIIKDSGFDSFEAYELAKLSLDEQSSFEKDIDHFETRTKQIEFHLETLLKEIQDKERPNMDILQKDIDLKQEKLDTTVNQLHGLRTKLASDEQINKQININLTTQKELDKDYYTIGELAELAHGNNQLKLSFERYVLGSFLDEILLQANIRLDRMTEYRYELIRSGEVARRGAQSGLDLEVLDHHTGQQRSVRTLSGGEGFKAALSLALGLADVVQAHAGGIQMDTLFIDEGFGTLDEVSLQQAIDCLKDLQDSNRLLGIISHVPHLKTEIHAKLEITPSNKGSKLAFSFGQN